MRNKKLFFAVLSSLIGSTSMADEMQNSPMIENEVSSMDPSADSDGLCENYASQESFLNHGSFAYVGLSGMWNSITSSFPKTTSNNNAPANLGNPTILQGANNTAVANPQAGTGITLSSTAKSLSQNSGGGTLTFGYCANVSGRAYIGFYGSLGMTSLSQTIPVTLTYQSFGIQDYSVNATTGVTTLALQNQTTETMAFQSTLKASFSMNAGISLGFRFVDSCMLTLKCGWAGLRVTSSVQNELSATNPNNTGTDVPSQSANYNPKYLNGISGSIGIDYFVTQRLSLGLEFFGTKYADKSLSLFTYHMDPIATINSPNAVPASAVIGTPVTAQNLIAAPMSVSSWGILLSVKVNFIEE